LALAQERAEVPQQLINNNIENTDLQQQQQRSPLSADGQSCFILMLLGTEMTMATGGGRGEGSVGIGGI
jgi:hypothetical protein